MRFDLIFDRVLRSQKHILPLLFSWILIFGFSGLACGLHLCHTGASQLELSKEINSHEGHSEEGDCCDAVSEFLNSEREILPGTGQGLSLDFSGDFFYLDRQTFPVKRSRLLPYYDPPAVEREIHILHQVFII